MLHAELLEGGTFDSLAHGDDDEVGGQTHLRLVGRHWGRAAAAHRADALGLADERRRVPLCVRLDAGRRLQAAHFHALHHGRLHLGGQRGHVLQAASIGHGDRGGTGAHGGASAVHGHIAAANDHHILAREVGILLVADGLQHVHGAHNAGRIGPFNGKGLAALGAHGHVHGVELVHQRAHLVRLNVAARTHLDVAGTQHGADILVEPLAGQPISGNAVAHHAAQATATFEYRHRMTHEPQEVGAGEPRGAGTHHRDAFARGGQRRGGFHGIGGHRVHNVLLYAADIHRRVHHRAATTILAGVLAHKRAGRREGIVLADHLHRLGKAAFLGQRNVGRHVHMGRAPRDAGHRLTRAGSAGARIHVAGELLGEGVEPRQHHRPRLPAHGAIGGVAQQRGRISALIHRRRRGAEGGHIAQQRRKFRHALGARRALAAGLRGARLQLSQHHPHRTLARRHGFHASGEGLDELPRPCIGPRRHLNGQTPHSSLFPVLTLTDTP